VSDRETDIRYCADPDFELGVRDDYASDDEPGPEPDSEFEQVYREHHAFVWRCARRMGVPIGDLDDVLQDTFVAAYRRFDSWDREVKATTWLFGILRNVMRNRVRGLHRHQRRIDALTMHAAAPVESGERMLAGELLRDFVARLDDDKRAVFVLAELEGMTGSEIAEILAINANTASSRLRAARQAFAEHFDHFDQRDHGDTRRRVERAAKRSREQPEQPPAGAAERTLALVLVGPAQVFGSAGVFAAGTGKLGLGLLGSLGSLVVAASVAVVAVVAGPWSQPSEPEAASEPKRVVISDSRDTGGSRDSDASPAIVSASASAFDEEPIAVIAESLARARPRSTAIATGDALPDLGDYEALRAAREQLVARQPAAALALLDGLEPLDPLDPLDPLAMHEGPLAEARVATRIAALCQLDRRAEAEASWSTLHAIDPDSAVVERLRDACWSTR
jgi:RNA polymerase sigma factor (sigma-70 family)